MNKVTLLATIFFQLSVAAQSTSIESRMDGPDPELERDLARIEQKYNEDLASSSQRFEKELRYDRKMADLVKMGVYAKTRGHWLLDAKIARAWLVPTAVALAGIYAHQRHTQLLREAAVRHGRGLPLTSEQRDVLSMSNRGRHVSAFLAAGVLGLIGYVATEMKHKRDLKELDASSEEEVVRKYQELLCETNRLGVELGRGQLKNDITGQPPECR